MELDFSPLPDLPQSDTLKQVASILWRCDEVQALWVGGSIAQGNADLYSDVDLRIAVPLTALDHWRKPDIVPLFTQICVAHRYQPFGEDGVIHHLLLTTGDLYDLWVQNMSQVSVEEHCLILGCRDVQLLRRLDSGISTSQEPSAFSTDPAIIQQILVDFWINSHKHCKVIHRNLDALVLTGLHAERSMLIRLWAVLASGVDTGVQRPSIHSMSAQIRAVMAVKGSRVMEVLGVPVRTRAELFRMIERMRDEVSETGRQLAERLGFVYPSELETTVRTHWREFLSSHE